MQNTRSVNYYSRNIYLHFKLSEQIVPSLSFLLYKKRFDQVIQLLYLINKFLICKKNSLTINFYKEMTRFILRWHMISILMYRSECWEISLQIKRKLEGI